MLVSFTIEMSNIVHLRKLFKFEICCRAPGWNKLAPNNTYIHYLLGSNDRAQPRFKSWESESCEARIEGAKRPRFEGEDRVRGRSLRKSGGWVWGEGSASPSQEYFGILNFNTFNLVYR